MATIDTTSNYLVWDNVEEVGLISRARSGDVRFDLAAAKRRAPTYKEMVSSGGAYTGQDLVWLLPAALVEAAGATDTKRPKPADVVEDLDGDQWTVLESGLQHLRGTWRLVTRNLAIAFDLRDLVTIERTTATQDAAGGRVDAWAAAYAGVPARIQETGAATADERGKRLKVKTYSVFVDRELVLQDDDRLRDAAGNVYEIKGYEGRQRIDQLPQLTCERRW